MFLFIGAMMTIYFREEKKRVERQRIAEQTKGLGRPKVGGPFDLVDQDGGRFTSDDMKGQYALVCSRFPHASPLQSVLSGFGVC